MTIKQQSFLVSNMCDEFMVCGCMRVWSNNLLNRAVCSEESRVMSIEGVTPLTCVIVCAVRPSRRKSPTKSFAIQMRSIYTAGRRIVLCFSSPLCCQNPSLCRMEDGKRWKRWGPASKTQMTTIHMVTFCRTSWVM